MNYAGDWALLAGLWKKHPGSVLFSCGVVWLLYLLAVLLLSREIARDTRYYLNHLDEKA